MTNNLESAFVLLPLFAFLGCWTAFWRGMKEWRASFLIAGALCGIWVVATTELLSLRSLFTRGAVASSWLLACILAWTFVVTRSRPRESSHPPSSLRESAQVVKERLSRLDGALLAGLGVILLLLAIVAFFAPPDTWDAMQYNMPRVVMWIENLSVHFYPTVDYQQLMMSPWAEYVMTNLTLLQGSDRLVNLVEWFAFLGSIIGVSLIARELGAGARGQILAAVFCGTIPQAILAATSAKPDVAVGFWIVASCYFLLRYKTAASWGNATLAGAAMGLACLTKGTAFILLPAFVLAIFWIWPWASRRTFLARIAVVLLVILALNGPQFHRNFGLTGSPLGFASPDGDADTEGQRHFANARFGVRDIVGNVLRSVALHLETPSNGINARTTRVFRQLIGAIGVDPDDPKMTEQGNSGELYPFRIWRASRSEVLAGNFLHFVLFVSSLMLLIALRRSGQRDTTLLALGAVGAFVLFCAAVRWQPYNGRFHLAVFMVACAVIGVVLGSRIPRWAVLAAAALALLGALPYALSNEMRPLLSVRYLHGFRSDRTPDIFSTTRERLYFGDQHLYLADSYLAVAHAIAASGCRDVGLDAFVLHYDYPMLALLRAGMGGPTVRYIHVRNRSAVYGNALNAHPCAVICLGCALVHQKWNEYSGLGVAPVRFDRNVIFFDSSFRTAHRSDGNEQAAPGPAALSVSTLTNLVSAHTDSAICNLLPDQAVQKAVGTPVARGSEGATCRYTGAAGKLAVTAFSPDSYYSRDFATLAAEGMGSLQVHETGYDATVVLDQGTPVLTYVHKGDLTYSLNIDRESPAPTTYEYVRLAGLLGENIP